MSWEIKILGSRRIMRQDLRRQLGTLSINQAKVVAGPEWERQEWLETWSEMLMWRIWWPQKSVLCSRMVIVNWTFTCIPLDDELGECYSRRRAEPGTTHHHYGPEKRWWYNGQVQQAWQFLMAMAMISFLPSKPALVLDWTTLFPPATCSIPRCWVFLPGAIYS